MRQNCSITALLWLLLPLNLVLQSTPTEMNFLPPPSNITARMSNMFSVNLKWNPIAANCTPRYKGVISQLNSSTNRPEWGVKQTSREVKIFHIPLNDYFSIKIQASCNGMESEWIKESPMQLTQGNRRTSVKNVKCVWHYRNYIICTWHPGEEIPPNVQYKLIYWEEDTNPGDFKKSMQFQDVLHTGTECTDYFPHNGLHLGCKFRYEYTTANVKELMFVVTDTSYSIKPFLYYTEANNIVKLRSPNIIYVSKAINNEVYVNWTVPFDHSFLLAEVLLFFSGSWGEPLKVKEETSQRVILPNSDDTWAVKVRVKLSENLAESSFWSDWSPEWTVQGKENNTILFLLLALIPAAVIIMSVILLVYLKRLKIFIFPPIPHPGKMFQNDLQHWLKSERPATICHAPEKEDISPVSLLEA